MHYKYLNLETDYDMLKDFTNKCKDKNYINNSAINRLGLHKYNQLQYVLGIEDGVIVQISGCHSMNYRSEYLWRVGYRAVSLSNKLTFASGGGIPVALCMLWIEQHAGKTRFITTTNSPSRTNEKAGKSHRMDRALRRTKGLRLLEEDYILNGMHQTIFEVDRDYWISNLYTKTEHTFSSEVII